MDSHSRFVWRHYVSPSKFNKFFIVAHSAGGGCLSSIQKSFQEEFYSRVCKVALTDSWTIDGKVLTGDQKKWMRKNFIHYVASHEQLGVELETRRNSVCRELSAGHAQHEYTTGSAHQKIFQ